MNQNFTQYAFTDAVKRAQSQYGSRKASARMEAGGDRFRLTPREIEHIRCRDGFYLGTTTEDGWPYVQYRGGPRGFLKVLDEQTLGMADYRGNRQYLSVGNIRATQKALLFLMDYPSQARLKIWAEAEVVDLEGAGARLEQLVDPAYPARVERALHFHVKAYDWNCPKHITPRYTADEIRRIVGAADGRGSSGSLIEALEHLDS